MSRGGVFFKGNGLLLICALLIGCAGSHSGDEGSTVGGSAAGRAAYQSTLYAFAQTQGCVKCHGSVQNPMFAAGNLSSAYSAAKGLVNFSNPTSSILITYAGNGHCDDTPCQDPSIRPTVQSLLQEWSKAEIAVGNGGPPPAPLPKYLTATIPIPQNLPPLTSAPTVVRFNLTDVNTADPSLNGALLEIEVQLANPTEYRFNRPKIAGNSAAVNITGIHVFVNTASGIGIGTEDMSQGTAWDTLSATAAKFALPTTLPAGPLGATPLTTKAIEVQVQSISDVITIGIDGLQ